MLITTIILVVMLLVGIVVVMLNLGFADSPLPEHHVIYVSHDEGKTRDRMIFKSKKEAVDILNQLLFVIANYGDATIGDLTDLIAGSTGKYKASMYGWKDLSHASVSKSHGGYVLNLPKAVLLDEH